MTTYTIPTIKGQPHEQHRCDCVWCRRLRWEKKTTEENATRKRGQASDPGARTAPLKTL